MEGNEEAIVVNELPHSVKISTNAKGDKSFEVKIYGATPEWAMDKAKEIDKKLEDHYRKE